MKKIKKNENNNKNEKKGKNGLKGKETIMMTVYMIRNNLKKYFV